MTDLSMEANPNLLDMVNKKAGASKACTLLKILANEDRLMILCQLIQGKYNVGELERLLQIHQPTLSQQLTVLREEALVSTERRGKYIYYSLSSPEALEVIRTLFNLYCQDGQEAPNAAIFAAETNKK